MAGMSIWIAHVVHCLPENDTRCALFTREGRALPRHLSCMPTIFRLGLNETHECLRASLNARACVPVSCLPAAWLLCPHVPYLCVPYLSLVRTCWTHYQQKPCFLDVCLNFDCSQGFSTFSLSFEAIRKYHYVSCTHSVNVPVPACAQVCVPWLLFADNSQYRVFV